MKIGLSFITVTPLEIQFKWEFNLQKIQWHPWGDPVWGDPDKRGSNMENVAFLHKSDHP